MSEALKRIDGELELERELIRANAFYVERHSRTGSIRYLLGEEPKREFDEYFYQLPLEIRSKHAERTRDSLITGMKTLIDEVLGEFNNQMRHFNVKPEGILCSLR